MAAAVASVVAAVVSAASVFSLSTLHVREQPGGGDAIGSFPRLTQLVRFACQLPGVVLDRLLFQASRSASPTAGRYRSFLSEGEMPGDPKGVPDAPYGKRRALSQARVAA
jgi:hypothetical protein